MSIAAYTPDLPLRRLPWVLPAAVLLVLLVFLGMGRVIRPPAVPPAKPKPLETRLYELPDSPGSLPARANAGRSASRHAQNSANTGHSAAAEATPALHSPKPSPSAKTPPAKAPTGRDTRPPAKTETAPAGQPALPKQAKAAPPPAPAKPARKTPDRSPPKLNWSNLQASVQSAVADTASRTEDASAAPAPDSEASLPNVHDPHTLVARYYIASLLRKLQRVGDMNYPTDQIGTPVLRLVIGSGGELQTVSLMQSSGNDTLDRNAEQIARQSSPFPPFPDSLKRKTSHIVLICHMSFEGYRQINPSF